jgi:hypothetical protein
MSDSKYTKNDAAKDTKSSPKQVSEAWHQARDDAAKDGNWGVPANRHGENNDSGKGGDSGDSGK